MQPNSYRMSALYPSVAIASGKGGTGKTTVAVHLAAVLAGQGRPVQYLDCDVEEPNGHLFLKPEIDRSEPASIPVPVIDANRCTACGRCAADAPEGLIQIQDNLAVVDYAKNALASSVAVERCPTGAIVWLDEAGARKGKAAARIVRKGALPVS